ncbi:MAG: hypothetical protein GIX00_08445 [Candidatus Eremiobacteraeota bacterium]|nr:hypothetical protein [Candidatus Eremiobacteraeota bacterium]MBC5808616.1 hypothetical protein [Candidatus Eremiobacteraeota bacterium]
MNQSEAERVDELIPRWLKDKRSLLVLDNCEHVVERVARLADSIHRSCPEVRIVATSRQALAVGGEKLWRLRSLAVPSTHAELDSAAAIQFGAIALFVDRASLVDQSFRLTEESVSVVADICRRLDGIALAIELAAARLKVLSVRKLAQKLDERFKILTGGSRTALPRQQTLRALIDWSYDLLSQKEQILFSRLGIFAGSFTLEAATSVCADHDIEEIDVFDLVGSLADKSLVVTGGDQERYHLLESTREYALERLSANGERERLARRHAEHFLSLAREAANSFNTMPLNRWLAGVEIELENYRAVLEWALRKGQDTALGGAVAAALECFWWHGGVEAEGRRWISLALDRIDKGEHPEETAALTHALRLLTSRLLFS